MNNDEVNELCQREDARTRKQVAQYVKGQLTLDKVDSWARDRAIKARFESLEKRIAWLEGAFMQAINAAEGDASHDAANDIEF